MADGKTATTAEMLQSVNEAILAVTSGGQSYKIGSRSLTRADLKELYAIKNDLTAQALAEVDPGQVATDAEVTEMLSEVFGSSGAENN